MDSTLILLCLLFVIIIFGLLIIFILLYINHDGIAEKKTQEKIKKKVPQVYCSSTCYGRGWHVEFYDGTTGQIFAKSFVGQIHVGRDCGSTELFWQMYVGHDPTISREQCVIYDNGGMLIIENKSQVNITQLNGYPVNIPYILDENSWIGMGRHNFCVTKIQQLA